MIYAPENGITEPAKLTAFSAVAVCRAIKKLYGIQPSIKWINDIFIGGKKVSGILTEGIMNFETARIESAVIGIGINISDNPDALPDDVKKVAERFITLGVSIVSLVIICLVEYALCYALMKMKKKDQIIFRMIGMESKTSNMVTYFTTMAYGIISFILVLIQI